MAAPIFCARFSTRPPASRGGASDAFSSFSATSSTGARTASAQSISRSPLVEQIGAQESIGLMGNHETMMRLALDVSAPWDVALDALANWLRNGGAATVRQFQDFEVAPGGAEELLTVIRVAAPERVRDWLASLRSHWRSQGVLFVHAGVNPHIDLEAFLAAPWNTPLAELDEDAHWAWVRWPFLECAPGPRALAAFSSCMATRPTTPGGTPRMRIRSPASASTSTRAQASPGLAKMAVFRGDEVKVLTALGPTNRMLDREEPGADPALRRRGRG